jgi:hypothetical protein
MPAHDTTMRRILSACSCGRTVRANSTGGEEVQRTFGVSRLADLGDAILGTLVGTEDAGACISDAGKFCGCLYQQLCWVYAQETGARAFYTCTGDCVMPNWSGCGTC